MTDPSDDWGIPEPDPHWWCARPGRLFGRAYQDYEQGIAYWGLDSPDQPPSSRLQVGQWKELQQAYDGGLRIARAARSLLAPSAGESLYSPISFDVSDPDVARALYLINIATGHATDDRGPCDSVTHPAAPDEIFFTTTLLEVLRFLPGISEEWLDDYSHTVVEMDRVLLKRVQILLGHLVKDPPERSSKYLSLVSRCYLLGLASEFAVMARAAIESALEERIEEEAVRATVGPARGRLGLSRYIDYCVAVGVFDGDTRAAANRVKCAGDQAIHVVPGLEPSPEALLEDLECALASLEQLPPLNA